MLKGAQYTDKQYYLQTIVGREYSRPIDNIAYYYTDCCRKGVQCTDRQYYLLFHRLL